MNEDMDNSLQDGQDELLSHQEKMELFSEYFSIEQDISVNILPLEAGSALPSYGHFIRHMPYSFRLASEVSSIEAQSLRSLRNLGHYGDDLVEFLKAQSRKIDLIMSYIMTMEDDDEYRLVAHSYGGGGITVDFDKAYEIGHLFKLKIFLTDEAAAIYCIGEVVAIEQKGESYRAQLYYARIREDDREILVRASLHQQSKQLKRLSQSRRQGSGHQ